MDFYNSVYLSYSESYFIKTQLNFRMHLFIFESFFNYDNEQLNTSVKGRSFDFSHN
jgi:hypothetical protein